MRTDAKKQRIHLETKFYRTKYSTLEKELLSIIHALQTWRSYLHGEIFTKLTGHHALKYMDTQKPLSREQESWIEFMHEFHYTI